MDNVNFDEELEDVVPEIYREHRHKFSIQPADIEAYKRQVTYRCTHIGTKELEIVLGDFLKINLGKMSYKEVEEFDKEIISMENPSMQRYLINGDIVLPEHNTKWMKIVLEYVDARKKDYYANIPKEDDLL